MNNNIEDIFKSLNKEGKTTLLKSTFPEIFLENGVVSLRNLGDTLNILSKSNCMLDFYYEKLYGEIIKTKKILLLENKIKIKDLIFLFIFKSL